jgi:hypothetical protein
MAYKERWPAKREEVIMTIRATFVTIITAFAAVGFFIASAMPQEKTTTYTVTPKQQISIENNSADQVKSTCDGFYAAPNSEGTYACLHKDGNAIVCGGTGNESKCYKFSLTGTLLTETLATDSIMTSESVPDDIKNEFCWHCDRIWCC